MQLPRLQSEWRRHQQRSLQATSGAAEPSPAAPPSSSPASVVVPPAQEDLRCEPPCFALYPLFVWNRQLCGQPQRLGSNLPTVFNTAAALPGSPSLLALSLCVSAHLQAAVLCGSLRAGGGCWHDPTPSQGRQGRGGRLLHLRQGLLHGRGRRRGRLGRGEWVGAWVRGCVRGCVRGPARCKQLAGWGQEHCPGVLARLPHTHSQSTCIQATAGKPVSTLPTSL